MKTYGPKEHLMWLPPPCLSSTISLALIPALIYSTPQNKWCLALSLGGSFHLCPRWQGICSGTISHQKLWQTAVPPENVPSISEHLLLWPTKAFCHHNVLLFFFLMLFMCSLGRLFCATLWVVSWLKDVLCWKKFVSIERGSWVFLFTFKLNCFHLFGVILMSYLSNLSNFPL